MRGGGGELRITSLAFARYRFAGSLVRTASDECSGQGPAKSPLYGRAYLEAVKGWRQPEQTNNREKPLCLPAHNPAVQKPSPLRMQLRKDTGSTA